MSEEVWSWVLAGFEVGAVCGLWFVGQRHWWGWGIVLLSSIAWLVYAITFHVPGFIIMSLLWGATHSRNMVKWFTAHQHEKLKR